MKNTSPRKIKAVADGGKHHCDAGYCQNRACVDYGWHLRIPGIPDECRFLCCFHARGIKGHDTVHLDCVGPERAQARGEE